MFLLKRCRGQASEKNKRKKTSEIKQTKKTLENKGKILNYLSQFDVAKTSEIADWLDLSEVRTWGFQMAKILITGGTVFVSKYVAGYYTQKGDKVYVLNRNHRAQIEGVRLIEADRHNLRDVLKDYDFDVVMDIAAYTAEDITDLLSGLGNFKEYIMISSSAVYPETNPQPFTEEQETGANRFWGKYGTDKRNAEITLLKEVPRAYILRPPYLYGPMNNVYREAFVFDCALQKRKFYMPGEGQMNLQFFYIKDLCRMIDCILEKKPENHIFNVGNEKMISIYDWVKLCYKIAGEPLEIVNISKDIEQRKYFCFYDYEYQLDVSKQKSLLGKTTELEEGLREAFYWYLAHKEEHL